MHKNILVINCGSSSLTYKVYRAEIPGRLELLTAGKAVHVAVESKEPAYLLYELNGKLERENRPMPTHRLAAQAVLDHLERAAVPLQVVGHRFVHGGTRFYAPVIITTETLADLERCSPLAPIHNPNSLSVIHLCQERLPDAVEYASFDTAFHARLPEKAYRYPLPLDLADRYGFRKYGFHGLSYQYVSLEASHFLGRPLEELKIVACHLGTGGSSIAAIRGGASLDTSMGYSPLPGLMMSTRSGDLDPTIVLELIGAYGWTIEQVTRLLNKDSGLIGISGYSSDLFELIEKAGLSEIPEKINQAEHDLSINEAENQPINHRALLAVDMYVHRLKGYIGQSLATLEGADALVFTDDIGVRSWQLRQLACHGMGWCGLQIDPLANRLAPIDETTLVSAPDSTIKVLSIPTDEEYVIAMEGLNLLQAQTGSMIKPSTRV